MNLHFYFYKYSISIGDNWVKIHNNAYITCIVQYAHTKAIVQLKDSYFEFNVHVHCCMRNKIVRPFGLLYGWQLNLNGFDICMRFEE